METRATLLDWIENWLGGHPPLNVWLGVSVEDQRRADERIPKLLEIPAAVRFLSCEPLIGPVDLELVDHRDHERDWNGADYVCLDCSTEDEDVRWFTRDPTPIDWVIVGGESGPGRRPMDPEWTRAIWQQCQDAGAAFFGKQGSGPRSDQQYGMPAEVFSTREWPDSPAAALVPEGRLL